MLYRVRHITTYDYAKTVLSSQHVLRLRPRLTDNQVCSSSEVAMTPGPRRRNARLMPSVLNRGSIDDRS